MTANMLAICWFAVTRVYLRFPRKNIGDYNVVQDAYAYKNMLVGYFGCAFWQTKVMGNFIILLKL